MRRDWSRETHETFRCLVSSFTIMFCAAALCVTLVLILSV